MPLEQVVANTIVADDIDLSVTDCSSLTKQMVAQLDSELEQQEESLDDDGVPADKKSKDAKPAKPRSRREDPLIIKGQHTMRFLASELEKPVLTDDEFNEHLHKYNETGDVNSKNEMTLRNLRYVVRVAKRLSKKCPGIFEDLISEGVLGTQKGVRKFKEKGYKFLTYGSWWIFQGMTRYISQQVPTIRLPQHLSDLYARIERDAEQLYFELKRDPTVIEVAERAGVTPEKVRELRLQYMNRNPVSLNEPLNQCDYGKTELGDVVTHDTSFEDSEDFRQKGLCGSVDDALKSLNPREAFVVRCRFGMFTKEELDIYGKLLDASHASSDRGGLTLEQTGELIGVTREMTRQIEDKALKKLKRLYKTREKLQPFYEDS